LRGIVKAVRPDAGSGTAEEEECMLCPLLTPSYVAIDSLYATDLAYDEGRDPHFRQEHLVGLIYTLLPIMGR
jgi:hypothetical protein